MIKCNSKMMGNQKQGLFWSVVSPYTSKLFNMDPLWWPQNKKLLKLSKIIKRVRMDLKWHTSGNQLKATNLLPLSRRNKNEKASSLKGCAMNRNLLDLTIWRLPDICLRLLDDCLSTTSAAWQLPVICLMTPWRLPDDPLMTAWWLLDNFLTTYYFKTANWQLTRHQKYRQHKNKHIL